MSKMSKTAKLRTRSETSQYSTNHTAIAALEPKPVRASSTKRILVLSMLNEGRGVTVPEIMQRTNWKHHSVRAFLATVVRRQLKQELISEKVDGKRFYRIEG